jgi:methyl-accepting chemotaxis protein
MSEPDESRAPGTSLLAYRLHAGRLLIGFLWANFVILSVVAIFVSRQGPALVVFGLALCVVSTLVWRSARAAFPSRLVTSLSGAAFAALFLTTAVGTYTILDLHMYFFAVLAIFAGWCCWRSLLAMAIFIVLHHLILNALYPELVFHDYSGIGRVGLHALIVVVEVGALTLIINQLTIAFDRADVALNESSAARGFAMRAAYEQKKIADAEASARERLIGALASFRANVDSSLGAIRRAGADLKESGENLRETATYSANAIEDIEQATRASTSGVSAITASTHDLAVSITQIEGRMAETMMIAHTGASKIGETSDHAVALGQSIERIEQLIGLIQNIANQTNLLALNATIESARAGEAGRGFSVVAGEVKALSLATARAVSEIEKSVGAIRGISDQTAASVNGIIKIIQNVDESAAEIAEAVRVQRSATEEIAAVISSFSQQSRQLAAQVESASRSAENTSSFAMTADAASTTASAAADSLAAEINTFLDDVLADGLHVA